MIARPASAGRGFEAIARGQRLGNEFIVGGVYISTIVPACVAALIASALLSWLLARIGFYRLVWHRPLVEVSIFAMLLAVAAALPPIGIRA